MEREIWLYLEKACYFMIGAQLLFYFLPSKKYEKYMGMLTGFICMVILVLPVCNLIFQEKDWQNKIQIEEFERQLSKVMSAEEIRQEKEKYQSIELQLEEIYGKKEQIKEQLEPVAKEYGMTIGDISYDTEEACICITVSEQKKKDKGILIEKITINQDKPETLKEELKEKMAKELMVDEKYIRIW